MRLEYQILAAVGLDLILGDPRWLPHPVRGIGLLASRLERLTRRMLSCPAGATLAHAAGAAVAQSVQPAPVVEFTSLSPTREKFAGILSALLVYAFAGLAAWSLLTLAGMAHPHAADAASVVIIYTSIAARDLGRHGLAVYRPLVKGDLVAARKKVSWIVGRDTANLDEQGIARAAVESVAESTVDGVTAPLFFAVIFGPIGAIVYRAVNTLDSMFGHKDERYRNFGWASARVDDLANYIPARITAPLMCLAAAILGQNPSRALRTFLRDGRKHQSPNSGLSEAAMAGAMGVQLGGVNYYDGQPIEKPTIGQARTALTARHILTANAMMFVTAALFLAAMLALRAWAVAENFPWRIWT